MLFLYVVSFYEWHYILKYRHRCITARAVECSLFVYAELNSDFTFPYREGLELSYISRRISVQRAPSYWVVQTLVQLLYTILPFTVCCLPMTALLASPSLKFEALAKMVLAHSHTVVDRLEQGLILQRLQPSFRYRPATQHVETLRPSLDNY